VLTPSLVVGGPVSLVSKSDLIDKTLHPTVVECCFQTLKGYV
jgi:hypothetical protein